ncbi:MAG: type II secretion system F family protein [Candidatus Omnitrophica bacterium]|nr:type II secretion system F family protein [Candidatus Omnitrophota bacterium]
MIYVITLLIFLCTVLIVHYAIPYFTKAFFEFNQGRAQRFATEMDRTMLLSDIRRVSIFYVVGPLIGGVIGFVVTPLELRIWGVAAGLFAGLLIPKTMTSYLLQKRHQQFNSQLVDALIIMSSSFRGGLSLLQSMEAVVEEMPDPIRQEFGIVLGENKIGVGMDEAMNRLYQRMSSPALQQVISSILLARETGGNLPVIFSRIVNTIREKRKLEENLMVLTLQGKLQAFVMSGLPVGFFFMVSSTNPNYFKVMTDTQVGRTMLLICLGLWLVGTFMIIKISSYNDF